MDTRDEDYYTDPAADIARRDCEAQKQTIKEALKEILAARWQ